MSGFLDPEIAIQRQSSQLFKFTGNTSIGSGAFWPTRQISGVINVEEWSHIEVLAVCVPQSLGTFTIYFDWYDLNPDEPPFPYEGDLRTSFQDVPGKSPVAQVRCSTRRSVIYPYLKLRCEFRDSAGVPYELPADLFLTVTGSNRKERVVESDSYISGAIETDGNLLYFDQTMPIGNNHLFLKPYVGRGQLQMLRIVSGTATEINGLEVHRSFAAPFSAPTARFLALNGSGPAFFPATYIHLGPYRNVFQMVMSVAGRVIGSIREAPEW